MATTSYFSNGHLILPTTSYFSFANSNNTRVWEKCRVWFPTKPPCSTDIDICEEGNVPILMSLPQMRNLNLEMSLSLDAVFLICVALSYNHTPAAMATSQHIVMNFVELKENPVTTLKGKYRVGDQTSSLALPDKKNNMTEDTPVTLSTHCLACQGVGHVHSHAGSCVKICPACRGQHRAHTYKEGCKYYEGSASPEEQPAEKPAPTTSSLPKPGTEEQDKPKDTRKRAGGEKDRPESSTTRKRVSLGNPEDQINPKPKPQDKSEGSSSSASPEPQVEEPVPPSLDPQEDDVRKSLKNIHDKLNNETKLYKLHLKHYHMTPQSFRHRTSALKLPKEVYDKYE